MMELRRNIADEMGKFAESYKSDYEIARARENSIKESLDSAVAYSQITNQAQVHLRELESNAHTARTIYETASIRGQGSKNCRTMNADHHTIGGYF